MKRFIPTALLLLGATISALADPVCIIGAGPAGLSAAHALETKGKEVVVFEKQDAVGGKCQAFYDSTFHPLGALLFTNETYREALKIIKTTDVKAVEFLDGISRWNYDWHTGSTLESPTLNLVQQGLLIAEIARYSLYWSTIFTPFSAVGYRRKIPAELTVTTAEWFASHKYQVLPALFNLGMFSYGYGDLGQVPIFYMLQYFHPDVIGAFANISPGYLIDFHEVMVQYSKTIKGQIKLNAVISHIDRHGAPVITYSIGSASTQTQSCSDLILAFPPTTAALGAANLEVTGAEKELLSAVKLVNYFSGAVAMNIPAHQLFFANSPSPQLPPEAAGEPVGILRLHDESNVATTWSWAEFGATITEEEGYDLLVETLSRVNKDPANMNQQATPITKEDVKGFRKHDYFPQVSGQDLATGWYQRFDKLQGQNKTYYASGLQGFETVEFALRAGQDVVAAYFKA